MSDACDLVMFSPSDRQDRFSQLCCHEREMFSLFLCFLVIVIYINRGLCLEAFIFGLTLYKSKYSCYPKSC
jgi:hypothetical protein